MNVRENLNAKERPKETEKLKGKEKVIKINENLNELNKKVNHIHDFLFPNHPTGTEKTKEKEKGIEKGKKDVYQNKMIELLERLKNNLMDPISKNLFENPIVTDCGHVFSLEYLNQWFETGNKSCPTCRNIILSMDKSSCSLIEDFVDIFKQFSNFPLSKKRKLDSNNNADGTNENDATGNGNGKKIKYSYDKLNYNNLEKQLNELINVDLTKIIDLISSQLTENVKLKKKIFFEVNISKSLFSRYKTNLRVCADFDSAHIATTDKDSYKMIEMIAPLLNKEIFNKLKKLLIQQGLNDVKIRTSEVNDEKFISYLYVGNKK
jgi:hypothetical protein